MDGTLPKNYRFLPMLGPLVKYWQSAQKSLNAHRYATDFIDTSLLQLLQRFLSKLGHRNFVFDYSDLVLSTSASCIDHKTAAATRQRSEHRVKRLKLLRGP